MLSLQKKVHSQVRKRSSSRCLHYRQYQALLAMLLTQMARGREEAQVNAGEWQRKVTSSSQRAARIGQVLAV